MKKFYKKKRKVRKVLLQTLYSSVFSDFSILNFRKFAFYKFNPNKFDYVYLNFLTAGIFKKRKILTFIVDYNLCNFKYFNLLDKLIIEISIFDIFFNRNIPLKVIINESIELSKIFSSRSSYILINKVLDVILKGYFLNIKLFF